MSTLVSPYLQTAAEKFEEFNKLFAEATNVPSLAYINKLTVLSEAIKSTQLPPGPLQNKGSLFTDKIITRENLIDDINGKIDTIRKKILPGSLGVDASPTTFAKVKNCVGYANISNNCWVNAMLQVCLHMDHLKTALVTVGNFYKEGNSFDIMNMNEVLRQIPAHVDQAVLFYNRIIDPIFKLKTIQSLQDLHVSPAILNRFIFPAEYAARMKSLTKMAANRLKKQPPTPKDIAAITPVAINHILKDPKTGYNAKLEQLKKNGSDLLAAIEEFDRSAVLGRAVPWHIAQNVREAFHNLFKTRIGGRILHSVSSDYRANEDSYEAITTLTGYYEKILESQGPDRYPPPSYFRLETRESWEPDAMSAPTPAIEGAARSRLEHGRYSSETHYDHQILITLPQAEGADLEDLLKSNCRYRGEGQCNYLLDDGRIQKFNRVEVRQIIYGAPEQLSIELNRFETNGNLSTKNYSTVRANRVMAIPSEMTTVGVPLAYVLQAFVVHRGSFAGGHYLSYRYIDGQWIEFDDSRLRPVSDEEIDDLLHNPRFGTTPYFFYYSLVPAQSQDQMLLTAATLRAKASKAPIPDMHSHHDHEKLLGLLETLKNLLQPASPDNGQLKAALAKLGARFPEYLKKIHHLIDISLGAKGEGEKLCSTNPAQLKSATKGWLLENDGNNLIAQLIYLERKKLNIGEQEFLLQRFDHFMTILYSKGIEKTFSHQFWLLPDLLRKQIQEKLLLTEKEALFFDALIKVQGPLQEYILEKLSKHPEINLRSIGQQLETQRDRLDALLLRENLNAFLKHIKGDANKEQLLEHFNFFNFPRRIKEQIFTKIGEAQKKNMSKIMGEFLFKRDPRILAQPAVLAPGETVEGDEATIIGQVILSLKK